MESIKRVRLVFKDDDVLSEIQKSEGLNRSWVLLNINQQNTISDVVSHLLHAFQIQHSCPHGLLLSIDGFVLPPFESTCILKDKDIIRVKKRGHTLAIEGNNIATVVEKSKALEKQPVNSGVLLLANEDFEKEKGGYEIDEPEEEDEVPVKDLEVISDGNDVSKKRIRKAAEECQDTKKKKKQFSEAHDNVAYEVHTEKIISHQNGVRTEKKSLSKKENTSNFMDTENVENNEEMARIEKPKENGQETEGRSLALEEPKKVSDGGAYSGIIWCLALSNGISRNTKRRYASRKLKKEMLKFQKKNEACVLEGP
ncbi:coilin-like isoform X2 [Olea europaea var. sylvestris]|uniref:coilin-like isoform X2 n=1 Tax=Olea europaea var. sylvestris TaxID=158386 RepID=UPI000C1D540C|nr:coilin-like isoform X2 [Olea europaea var. sylvestris]